MRNVAVGPRVGGMVDGRPRLEQWARYGLVALIIASLALAYRGQRDGSSPELSSGAPAPAAASADETSDTPVDEVAIAIEPAAGLDGDQEPESGQERGELVILATSSTTRPPSVSMGSTIITPSTTALDPTTATTAEATTASATTIKATTIKATTGPPSTTKPVTTAKPATTTAKPTTTTAKPTTTTARTTTTQARPKPVNCGLEGQVASIESNTSIYITFENRTDYDYKLYWLNYSGERIFYNNLYAGETFTRQTYITHPWMVADADSGTCRLVISDPTDGGSYPIG